MAKQAKLPTFIHCKVSKTTHARAPWRVFYTAEKDGKPCRVFKSFAGEGAALNFAETKDREISNHGIRYGDIPPEVRRAFDFFRDESAALVEKGADVPRFEGDPRPAQTRDRDGLARRGGRGGVSGLQGNTG